jgi:hypothetical protein
MGKGGGSDDEGEEQAADVRIDWMEARITNLGKYKPDKVLQMLATDESRNALIDFLDDEGCDCAHRCKGRAESSASGQCQCHEQEEHQGTHAWLLRRPSLPFAVRPLIFAALPAVRMVSKDQEGQGVC